MHLQSPWGIHLSWVIIPSLMPWWHVTQDRHSTACLLHFATAALMKGATAGEPGDPNTHSLAHVKPPDGNREDRSSLLVLAVQVQAAILPGSFRLALGSQAG